MKEEIYKLTELAIKADKRATNRGVCETCFCDIVKKYLAEQGLERSFLNWKKRNHVQTSCSCVLFYLQDLGIIKILSGTKSIDDGVVCTGLQYIINTKRNQGNKI